jgi:hypothetical protein
MEVVAGLAAFCTVAFVFARGRAAVDISATHGRFWAIAFTTAGLFFKDATPVTAFPAVATIAFLSFDGLARERNTDSASKQSLDQGTP